MAFDLSTATPVNASSDEGSSLLPGANEFPEIKQRAKKYKETEAERTAAIPTPNLAESAKLVPGVANDAVSQVGNLGQGAFNYIKENPLAVPEAVLAYKGGQAVYKNLKEKFFGQSTPAKPEAELFTKVDPELNVSNKPVVNEPSLDMALAPATTQTKETVDPIQAMKNKLLASDTKEQFIQRQFGPRYNPNPTSEPIVPPVTAETPPISPVTPKVELAPVDVVKPTGETPGVAALMQALNPEEQAAKEKLTATAPVETTKPVPPPEAPAPAPEGANAPAIPTEEQKATAEKAVKEKMPLFSDADKKAFTSEQRSVLQHMQFGKNPEEAKALLRHFENTLPEGVKLSYGTYPEDVFNEAGKKIKTAGTSKGGFPEPKQNLLNFWNEALGTNHAINEKGNFDYKPTAEDVSKAHAYWSDKLKNASTPAEIANAQKGFASLGALASAAGVSLAALGAMSAYKEGKETGDWSGLGLMGGSLIAGASAPAQIAYQAATYSKPLGETQEQLKEFGKRLEYANKVGYGRGMQGSTGGGQGFRGIAPPSR